MGVSRQYIYKLVKEEKLRSFKNQCKDVNHSQSRY